MPMKCVFDGSVGSIFLHVQIPYQSLLVRCADYPVVSECKWRPLDVCNKPWKPMSEMSRGVPGRIEVNNIETIGTRYMLAMCFGGGEKCIRGQSNIPT